MGRLTIELARAAANLHRAQWHSKAARPGSEEQRQADRNLIICDRAYHDARRAYDAAKDTVS